MEELDNLVKIGKLKKELPDKAEFEGMVNAAKTKLNAAKTKLNDVALQGLSTDSQFSLAYGAAHALALAALRWHGYRSEYRYLVFQCLKHTIGLSSAKCRILDKCHNCRNLAEYEGHLEIDESLLKELVSTSKELQRLVCDLPHLDG